MMVDRVINKIPLAAIDTIITSRLPEIMKILRWQYGNGFQLIAEHGKYLFPCFSLRLR